MTATRHFKAVVIGASAGGMEALRIVLGGLNPSVPVLIVQHLAPDSDSFLPTYLDEQTRLRAKEAEDKESLVPGVAYVAPPNYHLLVEADETLSLCAGERVNFSRPSIDVLFESAADAFGPDLIGVVLTGANQDGAMGLARIKQLGGVAIVQSPDSAKAQAMPRAALGATPVDHVLDLQDIAAHLNRLLKDIS
jgi:two-component system chemotaxis response regulator CheB